jgi:drug/metabolite transporter (DMT)-like permease
MGPVYCLLSAVGFGVMAIFAKLACEEGVGVGALLVLRFGLAGSLILTIALARGAFRGVTLRGVVIGLSMGIVGYSAQAGLYFAALTRVDA